MPPGTNRNYKNELLQQSEKDKATKLMINKQFIENTEKINRDVKCIFICKCGLMSKKELRQILGDTNKNNGSGLFCPRCTEINRNLKMNKKNDIDNKFLKLCIRWWLVKIGKNYTNRKKWSKEDILNICRIEYERNDMKALIPKNLDSLPGISIYNTYIREYKKKENYKEYFKLSHRGNQIRKTPGYPDIYICEHLGLVNERKEYLKNKFPCETDTAEELAELHIRPCLDYRLKNIDTNGFILNMDTFTSNNNCDIRSGLKKHKKDIKWVRNYFDLSSDNKESLRKDDDGYNEERNSYAEIVFDNFLVLYTDLTNENVKWEEPYPQEFVEKYDKKCLMDCKITIDDKIIIVEIWNFNPDNKKNIGNHKNRYEDYIKWRKIKEDYWKTRDDIIFIGIENENLYCNQCEFDAVIECKNILSPYINILDKPNKIECNIFPKSKYYNMIKSCRESFNNNANMLYTDKLSRKVKRYMAQHYGNRTKGFYEIRNILHNEINDVNWEEKYISNRSSEGIQKTKEKIKETYSNKSLEGKELISKKISEARNNFSPGKKEKIRKKQKQTMKENLHSKGVNNPMFGKKGKDNPNYGSKQPRHTKEEYETMYAPLICKFLQSLNDGDKINPSSDKWRNYCKPTIMPYTPWNNKPDYNPWYETKWIGFIETGIKYAEQNNITLPNFYYKKVVSSDKKNKKKDYEEEDIWNIHIEFIKYCDENNVDKTKKNADKYFRGKKFVMTIDTLLSKNNKNSEIFGTGYKIFLEKSINKM